MQVAAFILARADSRGLPGKNIIDFMGKPLLHWSIDAARGCAAITNIYVSTNGADIAACAHAHGCEVLGRPDDLATGISHPKDALRYHMGRMGKKPEIMILLQPTSPLRTTGDITSCLTAVMDEGYDSAATFVESKTSPYSAWLNTENGPVPFIKGSNPWQTRQALPTSYALNGAAYVAKTDLFLADETLSFLPGRAKMVIMPQERSVDIDTQLDLDLATAIYKANNP